GEKLDFLLEEINRASSKNLVNGRLIRIKDLKSDKIDFNLEWESIDSSELWTRYIIEIKESCLFISARWKSLQLTCFEYTGTTIYGHQGDIIKLRINEKLVNKAYIINELHSDYIIEQVNAFRIGMTIPSINWRDLREVVIKLPPRESQS